MKVAVDGYPLSQKLTGVGFYTLLLLTFMASRNKDVSFVVYCSQKVDFNFSSNVRFVYPSSFVLKNSVLCFIWRLFVPFYMLKDRVDVYWASNGVFNILIPVGVIVTIHDFVYRRFPKTMSFKGRWARRILQRVAIIRSDSIICNSNATAVELNKFYGRKSDDIIKPFSQFDQSDVNHKRSSKIKKKFPERFILVVGTLEPRKNLRSLIEAYNHYIENHEVLSPVSLLFVGRFGWNNSDLFGLVEAHPERYIIMDYLPQRDLVELYRKALCVWMPSLYEGFGMPLLEARLLGCPIVCSDVPAMREAAGDAVLYHQPTEDSIYDMVKRLYCSNFEILVKPETDSIDWDWSTGADKLMSVIQKVVENS